MVSSVVEPSEADGVIRYGVPLTVSPSSAGAEGDLAGTRIGSLEAAVCRGQRRVRRPVHLRVGNRRDRRRLLRDREVGGVVGDVVVGQQRRRAVRGRRGDQVRAAVDRLAGSSAGAEGDLAGTQIGGLEAAVCRASAGSDDPYTFVLATAETVADFFVIVKLAVL